MRDYVKPNYNSLEHPPEAAALVRQMARQEAELDARRLLLKHEIAHEEREGRDSAEWSADQSTFGVNAALLEATARTMRNIEDAMARLKAESYGRCLDCELVIPRVRLEALPFAERCRECQDRFDDEARQKTEELQYRPLF